MGRSQDDAVLVIGLGRFGSALAEMLEELGREVLGIDLSPKLVQEYSGKLTHVVEGDGTDAETLAQLGAKEFRRAVVAIGADIEASILATAALSDLGIEQIWTKAITEAHGRILERVGAHHVVFPEHDMGERVAHRVTGRMIDYVELDEGFALVETSPPRAICGKPLGETGVRKRYGVTVVCIKPSGESFTYATAETIVGPDDILVVAGETDKAEAFAELD
ncbi:MAG TPA: TrkA family potassium uptake protein [Actinomycetota bacterium]|nr:TrkA family potassium uptake protein [Actinomycetota bacterium]